MAKKRKTVRMLVEVSVPVGLSAADARSAEEIMKRAPWKVHTPNLLREILMNPGTGILTQPINIFARLLALVAERAIELHDPELDQLMLRLTLYEQGDPESKDFKPGLVL